MTRELKLALIVGFALVLTVAILVSDHLSKARTASLATVGGTQKVVAKVPDSPIRSIEDLIPTQLPPAVEVAAPQATAEPTATTPADSGEVFAPIVIGQQQVGPARETKFGLGRSDGTGSLSASIRERADSTKGTPTLAAAPQGVTPQEVLQQEVNKVEASKAAPLAAEKTHKIVEGDSLYAIARKYYGDASLWKKLAAANAGKVGDNGSVRVGNTIVIPSKDSLTGKADSRVATKTDAKPEQKASKPEAGKTKSYQVRPGDTLMNIARQQLGSASRSGEIASMNRMDPDDDLLAGAILKLPSH
ncbi:MAG: LysM peptidoglycan-binding domain-containing protein [Phycisphaeraceae bacterium]|nr:LysM peptidoglycan-binding domain-containing protein [Phycisphaeraceae bacterium]